MTTRDDARRLHTTQFVGQDERIAHREGIASLRIRRHLLRRLAIYCTLPLDPPNSFFWKLDQVDLSLTYAPSIFITDPHGAS